MLCRRCCRVRLPAVAFFIRRGKDEQEKSRLLVGGNRTDSFCCHSVVPDETLIILFIPRPRKIFLGRVFSSFFSKELKL